MAFRTLFQYKRPSIQLYYKDKTVASLYLNMEKSFCIVINPMLMIFGWIYLKVAICMAIFFMVIGKSITSREWTASIQWPLLLTWFNFNPSMDK